MGNEVASAPATTELDQLHDTLLTSLDGYGANPTAEAFKPLQEQISAYKSVRQKYQGELKVFNEAETKRNAPPEKYEFNLGKDSVLGETYLTTLGAEAKEKKYSQARASELLADREATAQYLTARQKADFQKILTANGEKLKADPVLGGVKLAETEEMFTRVIEAFGEAEKGKPGEAGYQPSTLQILKAAGATTDPMIVRMVLKIGQSIAPEKFAFPRQPANGKPAVPTPNQPPAGFSAVRQPDGTTREPAAAK